MTEIFLTVGVRSLAYGTVIGGLTTVLIVTAAAKWYQSADIDLDRLKEGLQERGQQTGAYLQSKLPERNSLNVRL